MKLLCAMVDKISFDLNGCDERSQLTKMRIEMRIN